MKLLMLSDINSPHTQKWAMALANKGVQVAIFSITQPALNWYSQHDIKLLNEFSERKALSKIEYLRLLPMLKKAIFQFKPDIVHAHYATSYGLLGALSGFHPFVISVWGSDVMDFPNRSLLHKIILQYNFKKADRICATSETLVDAIKKISAKKTDKIPFGIDTNYFKPSKISSIFPPSTIVIGTVKSLEKIYGIDILIKAFKIAVTNNSNRELRLLIVGGGSKEEEYKNLVIELNLSDKVIFTGKIEHSKVVDYHNMIDIFINVSRNESFGVAVLEASSCEKPIIASKIGGLKEVVLNDKTGFLVEPENIEATAEAIQQLIENKGLCKKMGIDGRIFVQKQFDFNNNLAAAIAIYKEL